MIVAVAVCAALGGCGRAAPTNELSASNMVYVDLETHAAVVQPATNEVPAVNLATGDRTLMPGLYCPKCQRWHPAPPFDKLQRIPGAATCPTDGTPLTTDGPWPEGDES